MTNRIDRSEFLSKTPGTACNSKKEARSTLTCKDDLWGTEEEHYRYVNVRDAEGNLIKREDAPEKNQKELRLIGQGHVIWDGHYVQVRVDKNNFRWYKHFPVAVQLAALGKITDPEEMDWIREEGENMFRNNQITMVGVGGKPTKLIQAMEKIKIIAKQDDKYILASDIQEAVVAVKDAEKVEEVKAVEPAVAVTETTEIVTA